MSDNLKVSLIHFYPLENAKQHHTDKFEIVHDEVPTPVIRRGQRFSIALQFENRGFDESKDIIKLVFSYGPNPDSIKGTKNVCRMKIKKPLSEDDWDARIAARGGNNTTIDVMTSAQCPVGAWNLQIRTNTKNSTTDANVFTFEKDVYILFNPWCCSDLVYMPDERLLDEYIETDIGKIWVGPFRSSRGREWVFGQFDAAVLPAAMLMFEKSEMQPFNRGDPIKTVRIISKMVNSEDDEGIIRGNWSGDYDDGTAPSAWTSSVPILQEYIDSGSEVKYGQCWVFAGVVTTICRALGIPSRVVSNLVSAHDTNASMSVDKYYSSDLKELDYDPNSDSNVDSVWNYHVWNDVWMARPDLPKGYGGWQAIDATPQETSDGVYQCGPASLEAIKQGGVGYNYDVSFVLASVNADMMRWKEDSTCDWGYSKIYCNKDHIGRMILTKQPFLYDPNGDRDRQDITEQYKPREGTQAERLSLYNAVRSNSLAKRFYKIPDLDLTDIEFELVDLESVKIGDDFNVVLKIKNNANENRTIEAVLSAGSVFYNGVKGETVKKAQGKHVLPPKSGERLSMTVRADDYLDKLVEYSIMKIYAIATVEETRQTWADEDDFQVIKPTIVIKIPKEIPAQKPTKAHLSFTNPLKKGLTKCTFNISGSGLIKNQKVPYHDVRAGDLVSADVDIVPRHVGAQKLVATFTSKELVDVTGTVSVEVYEDD